MCFIISRAKPGTSASIEYRYIWMAVKGVFEKNKWGILLILLPSVAFKRKWFLIFKKKPEFAMILLSRLQGRIQEFFQEALLLLGTWDCNLWSFHLSGGRDVRLLFKPQTIGFRLKTGLVQCFRTHTHTLLSTGTNLDNKQRYART